MKMLSQLRRRDASAAQVLLIVCVAVVMASLDLFVVNVALPKIGQDFGTQDLSSLSWVLNAYAIVYAALLVLFGRLAERRRRDQGFLLGVLIFTAASAACGLATSLETLVVFRVVQAAGAALLTPTSLSLVLATAAPEQRPSSVRAWTAVGGAAAALGPVVGGLLVAASWRWVFYVNVPIGLAGLYAGWRRLPDIAGHAVPRPDAFGAVLLTGGIGALTLGLVEGNQWGWGSVRTLAVLAAAAAAIAVFVARCRANANPLIDPALFRSRAYAGASVVMTLFSVAFGAMLLSIILWAQEVWGWSALQTGLAFAPGPAMVPIFAFVVASRLIARFGAGRVVVLGCLALAAGFAWWALGIGLAPDYVRGMLGGTILTGIGVGLTLPTLMATAASSLPPQAFATGSAVVNMLRQVGLTIGVAAFVAIVGTPVTGSALRSSYHHGWWALAGISLLTAAAGIALLRPGRPVPADTPAPRMAASAGEGAA